MLSRPSFSTDGSASSSATEAYSASSLRAQGESADASAMTRVARSSREPAEEGAAQTAMMPGLQPQVGPRPMTPPRAEPAPQVVSMPLQSPSKQGVSPLVWMIGAGVLLGCVVAALILLR